MIYCLNARLILVELNLYEKTYVCIWERSHQLLQHMPRWSLVPSCGTVRPPPVNTSFKLYISLWLGGDRRQDFILQVRSNNLSNGHVSVAGTDYKDGFSGT